MTRTQVLALLRRECKRAGGQTAWAQAHGLSQAHISNVLTGKRPFGAGVLDKLELERVVTYRRVTRGGKDA